MGGLAASCGKGRIHRRHRRLVRSDGAVSPPSGHTNSPHRHHPQPACPPGPGARAICRDHVFTSRGLQRAGTPGSAKHRASLPGRPGGGPPGRGRPVRHAAEAAGDGRGRPSAAGFGPGGAADRRRIRGRPRRGAGTAQPGRWRPPSGGVRFHPGPDEDRLASREEALRTAIEERVREQGGRLVGWALGASIARRVLARSTPNWTK